MACAVWCFSLEPVEHGDAIEVGAIALARHGQHGAGDRDLVRQVQALQSQERSSEMRGGREDAALHDRLAPTGFEEDELLIESDLVADAESLVEVEQVNAAAQQDVLAVVDQLTVGHLPGRGAPTQERTGFDDVDLPTAATQRRSGRQAGETAAND